ncbi:MAG: GNAT family N-acetyltransferase [Lachnospiraceae bacterium]
MISRKIKPEELKRTNELFAIAFEFETDNTRSATQVYEDAITHPQTREDAYPGEKWAAFEEDNATMMSCFSAIPYPIHFDAHHCTMVGIGGVASLPQYRRRGGIRSCFEAALPDMYAHDAAFSYLYPFSTAYYRKFGYEMCCERLHYQIRLDAVPQFCVTGDCILLEQELIQKDGSILASVKQVYEVWQHRYNLMVENESYEYAWVSKSNPPKDQCFSYLYKDHTGVAKGYLSFAKKDEVNGRNLVCSRFVFTDVEGFLGLMNLVRSYGSDHQYISFELPTDQVISALLPEWSMGAGTCSKAYAGMVRVINVAKVLKMAAYHGSGNLSIQISDAFIPQNNHTFLVTFENGSAIDVSATDQPFDIALGIGDFSRLIVGAYDAASIAFMPLAQINTDLEKLAKVFYTKPTLLTEYF